MMFFRFYGQARLPYKTSSFRPTSWLYIRHSPPYYQRWTSQAVVPDPTSRNATPAQAIQLAKPEDGGADITNDTVNIYPAWRFRSKKLKRVREKLKKLQKRGEMHADSDLQKLSDALDKVVKRMSREHKVMESDKIRDMLYSLLPQRVITRYVGFQESFPPYEDFGKDFGLRQWLDLIDLNHKFALRYDPSRDLFVMPPQFDLLSMPFRQMLLPATVYQKRDLISYASTRAMAMAKKRKLGQPVWPIRHHAIKTISSRLLSEKERVKPCFLSTSPGEDDTGTIYSFETHGVGYCFEERRQLCCAVVEVEADISHVVKGPTISPDPRPQSGGGAAFQSENVLATTIRNFCSWFRATWDKKQPILMREYRDNESKRGLHEVFVHELVPDEHNVPVLFLFGECFVYFLWEGPLPGGQLVAQHAGTWLPPLVPASSILWTNKKAKKSKDLAAYTPVEILRYYQEQARLYQKNSALAFTFSAVVSVKQGRKMKKRARLDPILDRLEPLRSLLRTEYGSRYCAQSTDDQEKLHGGSSCGEDQIAKTN